MKRKLLDRNWILGRETSSLRFAGALSLLLFCLLLAGCEKHVRWQEEVKLSTGEVIVIDRDVRHKGGGAAWPQGQGSVPMEHIIRFRYPTPIGPLMEWHSTKVGPRGTYAELPLVLDISADGTWFVFTRHWVDEACVQYVKYQFQNGVWAEAMLPDDIETCPTNLFLAAGSNTIKGLISIAEKNLENSSFGYPKHLKKVGPKQVLCQPNDNF